MYQGLLLDCTKPQVLEFTNMTLLTFTNHSLEICFLFCHKIPEKKHVFKLKGVCCELIIIWLLHNGLWEWETICPQQFVCWVSSHYLHVIWGWGLGKSLKPGVLDFSVETCFWGQNSHWSYVCLQLMDILDSLDKKVNVGLCMTSVSHHFSAPFLFTFMKSFIIQLPHLRWADLLMRTSFIRRDPEEKEGEIYVKLEALIHRPIWWYIHLLYVIAQSSGM